MGCAAIRRTILLKALSQNRSKSGHEKCPRRRFFSSFLSVSKNEPPGSRRSRFFVTLRPCPCGIWRGRCNPARAGPSARDSATSSGPTVCRELSVRSLLQSGQKISVGGECAQSADLLSKVKWSGPSSHRLWEKKRRRQSYPLAAAFFGRPRGRNVVSTPS